MSFAIEHITPLSAAELVQPLFFEVLERNRQFIRWLCTHTCPNDYHLQDDLMQELTIRLLDLVDRHHARRPEKLQDGYIRTVWVNQAKDFARHHRLRTAPICSLTPELASILADDQAQLQREQRETLQAFMAQLSQRDQRYIQAYLDTGSNKEAVRLLGITPNSFGVSLKRIIERIKEQVNAERL